MNRLHTPITEVEKLNLTSLAKGYLRETSKWCFFLSVVGFIGLALMFIGAFFVGAIYENLPDQQALPIDMSLYLTITYIVFAILFFFPVFYLFQFSRKLKQALASKDDLTLEKSFEMLKSHYKFIGVFHIIIISIYVFIFVLAMLGFNS